MKRRTFVQGAVFAGLSHPLIAAAQTPLENFERELRRLSLDPDSVAEARAFNERSRRVPGDGLNAQALSWTTRSQNLISPEARELIITCEVTSQELYRARYQRPIWPGGDSGVTIGIGYDLGYASERGVERDWGTLLHRSHLDRLKAVVGLRGSDARARTAELGGVSVDWSAAITQFDSFLPFAIGKTEETFPNFSELHEHSRGALVSLVYNRGPSVSPASARRREMREIRALMQVKEFASIPAKFREMRRLWEGPPAIRGLLLRRDAEASLFEAGLA